MMFIKDLKFVRIFGLLSFVLLLSTIGFGQSSPEGGSVADKIADSVGGSPQTYLLVRELNARQRQSFSRPIMGSDFVADLMQTTRSRRQKPLNLSGKKWRIIEIDGAAVETRQATIEFDNRKKRFGARICNSIGGDFKQTGSGLRFSRVIQTMMACREPLNSIEKGFGAAIIKVTRGEQKGDVVTFFAGRRPIMKLTAEPKAADLPLTGVRWELAQLNGEWIDRGDEMPYLQLDPKTNRIAGSTGCNQFFGKYELAARAIKFTGVGMTRRACLDGARQQVETEMARGFGKVTRYEIEGGELRLFAGNRVLMKFVDPAVND
jgi:heat shock protein HslJ